MCACVRIKTIQSLEVNKFLFAINQIQTGMNIHFSTKLFTTARMSSSITLSKSQTEFLDILFLCSLHQNIIYITGPITWLGCARATYIACLKQEYLSRTYPFPSLQLV